MPYEHIEERMLGEYAARFLAFKKYAVHVRLGWPKGVDRTAPDAGLTRRYLLSTLPEADLVARDAGRATIYEFTIWRPQAKISQLQLYRKLLPDTPGYEDLDVVHVDMRLVTGQGLEELTSVAEDAGIGRLAGVDLSLVVAIVLAFVLYVAALLLFLLDVASRRLRIAPSDLVLLWQILQARYQRAAPLAASRLSTRGVSLLEPVANFGDLTSPEEFSRSGGSGGQTIPPSEKPPAQREELMSKDATRNRLFEAKRRAQDKRRN